MASFFLCAISGPCVEREAASSAVLARDGNDRTDGQGNDGGPQSYADKLHQCHAHPSRQTNVSGRRERSGSEGMEWESILLRMGWWLCDVCVLPGCGAYCRAGALVLV